ncbi:MAG: hypothetical protein ACKVJ2_14925, partial [Pseudomonadales bacterium]
YDVICQFKGDINMSNLSKRSTVYFEPDIHQALKIRAASAHLSVSELVDEAVRLLMREDQEDLAAVSARTNEPDISYEDLLNDLKSHGKI